MSNTPNSTNGNEIKVFAPDGDVVLVVGGQEKKFRVSSETLSAASPVFKAMLGQRFREGQHPRSSTTPLEIPLPEDNSDAMCLVCRWLHLGDFYPAEDRGLLALQILRVAILADKYHLLGALRWQIRGALLTWLDQHPDCCYANALVWIIAAAYHLDCSDIFERATAQLISKCDERLSGTFRQKLETGLPVGILLVLEERRTLVDKKHQSELVGMGLCLECVREMDKRDPHEVCEAHGPYQK